MRYSKKGSSTMHASGQFSRAFAADQVGRPRPNFVAQCWPDGMIEWEADTGAAKCSDDAIDPAEGRKSFPSGVHIFSPIMSNLLLISNAAPGRAPAHTRPLLGIRLGLPCAFSFLFSVLAKQGRCGPASVMWL
jgi:hypothetical protein